MIHLHSSLRQRGLRARSAVSLAAFALACSDATDVSAIDAESPAAEAPELDPAQIDAMAESVDVFLMNVPFFEVPPADDAIFISMSDGVRLAANLWFPEAASRDDAMLPTLYVDEWYGRGDEAVAHAIELWRGAGFAVALVDARGYGASFGSQTSFMTPRARTDQVEVLRWLASQAWSNGRVAVAGLSLSGALAGVMTGSARPTCTPLSSARQTSTNMPRISFRAARPTST